MHPSAPAAAPDPAPTLGHRPPGGRPAGSRRRRTRTRLALATVAVLLVGYAPAGLPTSAAAASTAGAVAPPPVPVQVDANAIAAANVNGLTFKGFGVLSANSTSALLMDYKAQHPDQYVQLLKTLFGGSHPMMNTVKIEMGDDRNTSTGPEPATMRTATEEADVAREPGFQLAADAKKYNPNLRVAILRWEVFFFDRSNY